MRNSLSLKGRKSKQCLNDNINPSDRKDHLPITLINHPFITSPVFPLCMPLWLVPEELNVLNKVQSTRSFLLNPEYFLGSAKERLKNLMGKCCEKSRISSAFGRL